LAEPQFRQVPVFLFRTQDAGGKRVDSSFEQGGRGLARLIALKVYRPRKPRWRVQSRR
jgi:hypothetical protein